jgi:hypothetical protein
MSDEARNLGWYLRFCMQWQRLWPVIANDFGWTVNNILMVFIFVGPLLSLAVYLTAIMQFHDLLMTSIRACTEMPRFYQLQDQYQSMLLAQPDNELLKTYVSLLQQRILREQQLFGLSLFNFTVLFLVALLPLCPIFASSPLILMLGAAGAVLITFVTFCGRQYLTPAAVGNLTNLLACDSPQTISSQSINGSDAPFIPKLRSSASLGNFFKNESLSRKRAQSEPISPNTVSNSFSNSTLCPSS